MKKTILGTFLTLSFGSMACELSLPQNLVIFSQGAEIKDAFMEDGCSPNAVAEIAQVLKSVEGRMTSFQLKEILKSKNIEANISPDIFQVQQLPNMIREQISLPAGYQLRNIEAFNGKDYLSLNAGEKVSIKCDQCAYIGKDPISLEVRNINGETSKYTVMAQFKKLVKAYRVKNMQGAFMEVSPSSLSEEYVESIPQTDLISDLSVLRFYKCNKPIRPGELLKKSDLHPVNLVRAGVATEVVIENELVKIKTNGISRSNGAIGDFVEVFQPSKNKKYYGKVIDLNKVHVDL